MHTKVSVIIPCYNCSTYIQRCFSALEAQSFKDFEIVFINDCSVDNTEDILTEYASKTNIQIKVLTNDVNSGPAYSRKRGVEASDSDFICFCDCDDWFDSSFIEDMVAQQSIANADIVFCGYKLVYDNGKISERPLLLTENDLTKKTEVLVKSNDSLCMMMIRRELIANIAFPDFRNGEDMALVQLLISKSSRFAIVNKCGYNYFCRANSASQTANISQINCLIKSFSFIDSHLADEYKSESEFLGIRNLLYGALINLFKFTSDTNIAHVILNDFEVKYPNWKNNKYLKNLSKPKRVFLILTSWRLFPMMKLMSKLHQRLSH